MMLNIHAIPAFNDNYIWFIQAENSQKVLIVDPGDAGPVIEAISQQNLIPVALLITHGCHDHIGGIEQLLQYYDIPVYGPKNEFIPSITHALSAQDELIISADFPSLSVLDIPGHTKGHIGFVIENCLFCGDALFAAGCGRLHSGPAAVLFDSLQQISLLPEQTEIYCAHEYTQDNLRFAAVVEANNAETKQRIEATKLLRQQGKITLPSLLSVELKTNPFLRCDQIEVKQAVERHCDQTLSSTEQVFTELRKWKDQF